MRKPLDLSKPFGRLTPIREVDPPAHVKKKINRYVKCRCSCGKIVVVYHDHLRTRHTQSCGCFSVDRHTSHGLSYDPAYTMHWNMMRRCYHPNCKSYENYGERGITVCKQWHDVSKFVKWAYKNGYAPDLTIERIDHDGNYCPENCTFIPASEQGSNKRNNFRPDSSGLTLAQICKQNNWNYKRTWFHLRSGKTMKDIRAMNR